MVEKMGDGLTIFVLDDEKDICYFLREFFSKRGFAVYTALTGQSAVNLLKSVQPDIAILDIYLFKGKMNGIDVLRFIKEKGLKCYCLMVTRADDEKLIHESKELGAVDYLLKPLTLPKVEKAINGIVKMIRKGGK